MATSDQGAPQDPEEYEKWAEGEREQAEKYYDRQDAATTSSDGDGDGWSSDDDWGHDDSADSSDGHGS